MDQLPFHIEALAAIVRAFLWLAQAHLFVWLYRSSAWRGSRWLRIAGWTSLLAGSCLIASSDLLAWDALVLDGGRAPLYWRLLSAVWVAGLFGTYCVSLTLWAVRRVSQAKVLDRQRRDASQDALTRRRLVSAVARVAVAAPFAVAGYGTFIGRNQFELREVDLRIPGLPPDLDGLRIAQLTDIHCGAYLTTEELRNVVGMVNESRPHVAVVTGDLITKGGDPLEQCLDTLAGIKSEAGVYHCLGNHEVYTRTQDFVQQYCQTLGMAVLRQQSDLLTFGDSRLNICGVDYQRQRRPYLVGAESMVQAGAFNVLLTHNPDVFRAAARMGYDLVVAGHTHGGQVTVEIAEQWVNAARFSTPFVAGRYTLGDSNLYVSRGIGTVNLPMRIGALPEVTLLRLHRA